METISIKIESGHQLFSRVIQRPPLENLHPILFPNGGPKPNQIIQVTGENSTGKTLLLTELTARCILPQTFEDISLPGNNSGTIFINTDHHFNLLKLIEALETIAKNYNVKNVQNLIEISLKNLQVLNCYSAEQFKLTVANLERILNENLLVNFLCVDSLSAYYWTDRQTDGTLSLNLYCSNVLGGLRQVVGGRNVSICFSKFEGEQLVKQFNQFVDFSFYLKRNCGQSFEVICYDHGKKTRFCKSYQIDKLLVFD